nr:hypothetical protein DSAG12_00066 [Candidatus Prometheoarchaeum syntrophicum]
MAFDDGQHSKEDLAKYIKKTDFIPTTPLVGVTTRGIQLLHLSYGKIEIDGTDSTNEVIRLFKKNPYRNEIRLIMIDSPTLGGFNPPNPFEIYEKTKIPILLLPGKKPKTIISEIYSQVFPERDEQIEILKKLPKIDSLIVSINQDPKITREIFFHAIGITKKEIVELLKFLSEYSAIPEPLRLAHIAASSYLSR